MSDFKPGSPHENHDVMNKLNPGSNPLPRSQGMGYPTGPVEIHESVDQRAKSQKKFRPEKETLVPARGLIQAVHKDVIFAEAKRMLGLFPQVAYKLCKAAGFELARLKTAYVLSLFATNYFTVTLDGDYDNTIGGSQQRARNCLMGMVYGHKPYFLEYAGPFLFQHYPHLREELKQRMEALEASERSVG